MSSVEIKPSNVIPKNDLPLEHHNRNREANERSPTRKKKAHHSKTQTESIPSNLSEITSKPQEMDFNYLTEMLSQMMTQKQAQEFRIGIQYATMLLAGSQAEKSENSLGFPSEEVIKPLLFQGLTRYKELVNSSHISSFGRDIPSRFDFFKLFENKLGAEVAKVTVRPSEITDMELADHIERTLESSTAKSGSLLTLKAYELEAEKQFPTSDPPVQLHPEASHFLKPAS